MVICSLFGSQGKGPFCVLRYLKCSNMKLGPQLYHFSDQWEEKPYSIHLFKRSSIKVISGHFGPLGLFESLMGLFYGLLCSIGPHMELLSPMFHSR